MPLTEDNLDHPEGDGPFPGAVVINELFGLGGNVESTVRLARVDIHQVTKRRAL